jgi:L-alanine-DL-glutamate epimerase-like enolase superfamily enzyme
MNISSLIIKRVNIPFKVSFKHSSATRTTTQSIWIEATSDRGTTGYGEGCPREYVTRESIETALNFFRENESDIIHQIHSLADIRAWSQYHRQKIDQNPAAWCAIELALLDMMAKEQQTSIECLLDLPEINAPFQYSAVLGDSDLEEFEKQLYRYRVMGFEDFKLKISGNLKRDLPKFNLLRESMDASFRVRLDANNLWRDSQDVIQYLSSIPKLFAIEEPLETGNYGALWQVGRASSLKVILDESFLRIEDFQKIDGAESIWIINLRISKMGGLLRSMAIAEKAKQQGIQIIIGAQVGETSLLTRSALTIANAHRDILIAQEGAFGTLLLQSDICEFPLMFGKNGSLEFTSQEPYGFQLHIKGNADILNPL